MVWFRKTAPAPSPEEIEQEQLSDAQRARDGHCAAAAKAAGRGDMTNARWHLEQQKAAVEEARQLGAWWIHR
ncbi:hypothetical protein ACIBHX_46500 [Nonomuraea sp. NPDC050536]|uniref:hypothetical protein n=1 Tax=Nonomuraea sp. NPDC050536 TaxID=3364366 RepID=UPI0037C803CD